MAGRPKKTFTDKEVEQIKALARCHCPDSEIAAFVGVAERTLQRHFGATLKEQREAGRANLRSWQFSLAQKGNATMLIWLGKQLLGQRDGMLLEARMSEEDEVLPEAENTPEYTERVLREVLGLPNGERNIIDVTPDEN